MQASPTGNFPSTLSGLHWPIYSIECYVIRLPNRSPPLNWVFWGPSLCLRHFCSPSTLYCAWWTLGSLIHSFCRYLQNVCYKPGAMQEEEKGTTEDEMFEGHCWLNGHEFKQTPGDGEGQGSLACCSPQSHKESDTTEWLNNNTGAMLVLGK